MGKRLNFIKELQKGLTLITQGTVKLYATANTCEDLIFKDKLMLYAVRYATLNYELSCYLIAKLSNIVEQDRDEDDFNTLMGDNFGK